MWIDNPDHKWKGTLWISPSFIIEQLNFLNNSYSASTSLTVTAMIYKANQISVRGWTDSDHLNSTMETVEKISGFY